MPTVHPFFEGDAARLLRRAVKSAKERVERKFTPTVRFATQERNDGGVGTRQATNPTVHSFLGDVCTLTGRVICSARPRASVKIDVVRRGVYSPVSKLEGLNRFHKLVLGSHGVLASGFSGYHLQQHVRARQFPIQDGPEPFSILGFIHLPRRREPLESPGRELAKVARLARARGPSCGL
jgi:hypothetical protein